MISRRPLPSTPSSVRSPSSVSFNHTIELARHSLETAIAAMNAFKLPAANPREEVPLNKQQQYVRRIRRLEDNIRYSWNKAISSYVGEDASPTPASRTPSPTCDTDEARTCLTPLTSKRCYLPSRESGSVEF